MHANSTATVVVEGGGEQVVAHVGLHALGSLADRLGLGEALSEVIPAGLVEHDRGKVLVQAMLMLAGGGEACSDIERLRAQPGLFGSVPSDSTLYRTLRSIDPVTLGEVWAAAAGVRAQVWRRSSATTGTDPVILDLDASLVEIHSENKQGTAATYKGGFGFAPMFCFADATGEALGAVLRPGNATANSIDDQLAALDAALAQLPAEVAAGHRPPRRPGTGAPGGAGAGRLRRCQSQVGRRVAGPQRRLRRGGPHQPPTPGRHLEGRRRQRLLGTGAHPGRRRAQGRRGGRADRPGRPGEVAGGHPAHRAPRTAAPRRPDQPVPRPQFRYWGHYTDADGDPVELDVDMRAHARVEDHIRRLKASGLERFPFVDLNANRAWLAIVCLAADLVRWFQLLCLTGRLAAAEPKALRWQLWHTPARLVCRARRRVVRILDG